MVLRRKTPGSLQSSSLLSLQPQVLGIKAPDMAAVVLLVSALLKIKALQANMAHLLNPSLMNASAWLYSDSSSFLLHVC